MYVDQVNNANTLPSIVNNGEIYPVYPLRKVQVPEIFAVITSSTTVSLLNRNIVINGGCNSAGGVLQIPFFGIKGPVDRVNCQTAVKKKIRLTCYERPCAENVFMGFYIKRALTPYQQHQGEYPVILAFDPDAPDACVKTCTQKIAEFITYANTIPEMPVVVTAVSGQATKIDIEAIVAGEDFILSGYEGFSDVTVITENRPRVMYADDLKGWGIENCLTVGDCDPAVCLNTFQFTVLIPKRHDSNDDVSTSTGMIGGSHYLAERRVVLAWSGASVPSAVTDLTAILNGSKNLADYVGLTLNAVYPAPTPVAPTPTPTPTPTPAA